MKRLAVIFTAILLMVFTMTAQVEAANSFKITETSPSNGYNKVQATNVMIKIFFNQDIDKNMDKSLFTFKDAKGKDVSFEIIPDPENAKNVNLLVKKDLKQDTKYIVTVSEKLKNASGEALGKKETIKFATSKGSGGLGYGLLMMAMVAVMVALTIRDQRRKAKEAAEKDLSLKIETNPYKLAKEKNISVKEATALIDAEKEKLRKKREKQQLKAEQERKKKLEQKPEKKVYKVKSKRVVHRK